MYVLLFHDSRLMANPIYRKGRGEQFWVFSTWYLAFCHAIQCFPVESNRW